MRRILLCFGDGVSAIGVTIAAVCLIAIVVINGVNVAARYAFRAPFSWAEEAMIYLMITGIFWGAIGVAWRQMDIRIDAFVNLASGRRQLLLRTVATMISIFVLSWLLLAGIKVATVLFKVDQRSTALDLPMWVPHIAFASGLLLAILMMFVRLLVPADTETQPTDPATKKDG